LLCLNITLGAAVYLKKATLCKYIILSLIYETRLITSIQFIKKFQIVNISMLKDNACFCIFHRVCYYSNHNCV